MSLLMQLIALILLTTLAQAQRNADILRVLNTPTVSSVTAEQAFDNWARRNGKQYQNEEEKTFRTQVLLENARSINQQNRRVSSTSGAGQSSSYRLELNKFGDLTSEEFSKIYLRANFENAIGASGTGDRLPFKVDSSSSNLNSEEALQSPLQRVSSSNPNDGRRLLITAYDDNKLAPSGSRVIDWRSKGFVSDIRDQGNCGACWAFAVASTLESLYHKKHGQQRDFSEQQLVDCTRAYFNYGCSGGWLENNYYFVMLHGIALESEYPYTSEQGLCTKLQGDFKISSYKTVPGDCDSVLAALQERPLAVAVQGFYWQFYGSGVFDNCGFWLDHAAMLVGADLNSGYWTIKNSWGKDWGEDGYIRLAMGNTCGLCFYTTYPVA